MSDQLAVSCSLAEIRILSIVTLVSIIKFCSFFSAQLTEDFCGVEPVTHPPIEVETRPPPLIDEDKLRKAYSRVDSVVLGSK